MPNSRKNRKKSVTASPRAPRPSLTVNTRISNPATKDKTTQSAPVGTRQERGFPPMYKAVDLQTARLRGMMGSPTWRKQNPGPHVPQDVIHRSRNIDNDNVHSQQSADGEDVTYDRYSSENTISLSQVPSQSAPGSHADEPAAEKIHLGYDSDSVQIHNIVQLPESSEVIISAFLPQRPRHPQSIFEGEQKSLAYLNWIRDRGYMPAKAPRTSNVNESRQSKDLSNQEGALRSSLAISHRNDVHGARAWDMENSKHLAEDAVVKLENRAKEQEQDSNVPVDDSQRFRGLIDRLHHPDQRVLKGTNGTAKAAVLNDPAIVTISAQRVDHGTPTRRRWQTHSDSGYASRFSGSFDSDTGTQHKKNASYDSELQSPLKSSSLNPTAKEFLIEEQDEPPHKKHTSVRPRPGVGAPTNHYTGVLQTGPVNETTSFGSFPPIHQGNFSFLPGMPAHVPNSYTVMPPPPFGITHSLPPALPHFPGQGQGMIPHFGFGLNGLVPPVGLASPSIASPSLAGAFHHQLPSVPSQAVCNNPEHLIRATPAGLVTGNAKVVVPRHVPKPKIPDTESQQNWEHMHELRKMAEPGYALKCKEKQKKRFSKQLQKSSHF